MKKYQTLIFDAGDTLVKYQPNYFDIYSERLASVCARPNQRQMAEIIRLVYTTKGQKLRDEAALRIAGFTPDEIDKAMIKLSALPLPRQEIVLCSGTKATLDSLRLQGVRMAVVSNHHAYLLDVLKELGIAEYFESIVISECVGIEKPDPRILTLAMDRMGISHEGCLYIGDQVDDIICAHAAGVDVAFLNAFGFSLTRRQWERAIYRIDRLEDVLNYVE